MAPGYSDPKEAGGDRITPMPWVLALLAAATQDPELDARTVLATQAPRASRSLVRIDPVEQAFVRSGDTSASALGASEWKRLEVGGDGWFQGRELGSGYALWQVSSGRERTMLLEARGHNMVYVDGEPRTGDPYQFGYVSLPVRLRKGVSELLFHCSRGRLSARLVPPPAPVSLDVRDATLPDVAAGMEGLAWAAVVVRNAEPQAALDLELRAVSPSGRAETTVLPSVPALGVRKAGFQVPIEAGRARLELRRGGKTIHSAEVELRLREPGQARKVTFVSGIDGSVQYFGLLPSTRPGPGQALFLSLHGASVEAIGQAEAYGAKSWGHVVAPTNRRPFGFDWEDVGRKDGMEVLGIAESMLETDPAKTYVTGHSMGGHGAWQFGVHFPGRFAGVAPCAGWQSFWTYAGGARREDASPAEQILLRASSPSDTLKIAGNLAHASVYVLHGDADETVPVSEPRAMRAALASLPVRLAWHEEKGQGHWYDTDPEPGANCVDWPPIFDTFAASRVPGTILRLQFSTVCPAISSQCHWAQIEQQERPFELSSVDLAARPAARAVVGTTVNVARLRLEQRAVGEQGEWWAELDGQRVSAGDHASASFVRRAGVWQRAEGGVEGAARSPLRGEGIKGAFDGRVALVYGTSGTREEQAWALAKAKYDAETFWYRGNGSVDVLPDKAFVPAAEPHRNVLLYGNAETNRHWASLLAGSPYVAGRTTLWVGARAVTGTDLGYALAAPRPGSPKAVVVGVGGTSPLGRRMTYRMPFFTSGAGLPDFVAISPLMLETGADGVRAAGFLDNEGRVGDAFFAD